MKKAKLDRSRSFGEVIGIVDDGVRYKQDGKDFDAQENEVNPKASAPVSSGNSGITPSDPRYVPASAGTSTTTVAKKKRRKRRTKAQMAAARVKALVGKPREIFQ